MELPKSFYRSLSYASIQLTTPELSVLYQAHRRNQIEADGLFDRAKQAMIGCKIKTQ